MPRIYSEADAVARIASSLIPNYHPELAEARIFYCFTDKASTKGGRIVPGKVRKCSGFLEWVLEQDFIMEIATDEWNPMPAHQRTALVDHLLEHCTGEQEEDGSMKWAIREPDVQEFASIVNRHGAWNTTLAGFIPVAQQVSVEGFQEEADEEVDLSQVSETVSQG